MPRLSKLRKAIVTAAMRESIYEAAASVLCKHGIGGTTMNRVAAAAKVTKSNLYNYFRDKDELMQCFNDRLVEPCLRAAEEIAHGDLPASRKLEKMLRMAWEYAVKHKGLVRLIAEGGEESKIRRTVRPRFITMFATVFEQGIHEGAFREHDTENTSRMLFGVLMELFALLAEGASNERLNHYVESMVDGVLHGFSIHTNTNPSPS